MPLHVARPQLFSDDTNPLPQAGSPEQAALLDDELEVGHEGYLEFLSHLSDVTDNIYPELVAACRNAVAQALPGRALRVLDLCAGVGVVTLNLVQAGLPIERSIRPMNAVWRAPGCGAGPGLLRCWGIGREET